MSFADADGGNVNPDIAMGGGYGRNCQSAVVAYVARRKGWDVQAIPAMPGSVCEHLSRDVSMAWRHANGSYVSRLDYEDFGRGRSPKEMQKAMESRIAQGRIYTIDFSWKGGGGHICILERDGSGNMLIYDAQGSQVLQGERMMAMLSMVDAGQDVMLLDVTDLELDRWVAENILRAAR